jgi:L-lactate dehydrogenase complex protein LldG
MRAQFGVAESGAVWLTQEDLIVDALAFLSQHLVVLLDPNEIVSDMHEAYRRVQLSETAYGCFMMGGHQRRQISKPHWSMALKVRAP